MAHIKWGPALELGIPELDTQHRTLVDIANRLFEALREGPRGNEASLAVEELFAYSALHFADEEAYFSRFNFPSLDRHRLSHQKFMDRTAEFQRRVASGSPTEIEEILYFLETWITRHVGIEDRELVRMAHQAAG
jgi:hemerythrin